VFVPGKPLKPILIFAFEAKIEGRVKGLHSARLSLYLQIKAGLKSLSRDKHSSLFILRLGDEVKKRFYDILTRTN
jgi:hypothetical protein